MAKASQTSVNSDEWMTVRDFTEDESGYTLPKYEAKFVEDVRKEYVEDEIVLVKETSSFGSERTYYVPKEAIEVISRLLPK